MLELLAKLERETAENYFVYWQHVVKRDVEVIGTFTSSRGTVRQNANLSLKKGTRFSVLTTSEKEVTGYVPCYLGLLYITLPLDSIEQRAK
jgi:hypothetical protein